MHLNPQLGGLCLVEIAAGQFTIGSGEWEGGHRRFESPPHRVIVSHPFAMSATPITQAQFEAVMGYNPSYFSGRRQHPVENLSWHQAAAFCNALSELAGLPSLFILGGDGPEVRVTGILAPNAGRGAFRLPTEEEWEYACRADTTTRYWWGDDEEGLHAHAWWRNNSGDQTQPVGASGHQNPWGLSDMIGNVWEWCVNPWRKNYADASSENDPRSVIEQYVGQDFAGLSRVWRGGSWFCANARDLRCSFRVNGEPRLRSISLGFRVVRCQPAAP